MAHTLDLSIAFAGIKFGSPESLNNKIKDKSKEHVGWTVKIKLQPLRAGVKKFPKCLFPACAETFKRDYILNFLLAFHSEKGNVAEKLKEEPKKDCAASKNHGLDRSGSNRPHSMGKVKRIAEHKSFRSTSLLLPCRKPFPMGLLLLKLRGDVMTILKTVSCLQNARGRWRSSNR